MSLVVDEQTGRAIGLARRVLQSGREMQAALARGLGLRATDVQAMDYLASIDEPTGTVELGERLGIRSASAEVLVDRLVEAGSVRIRLISTGVIQWACGTAARSMPRCGKCSTGTPGRGRSPG